MHARHLPALRRLALALAPLLATSAACDDGGGGGSTADAVADATGGPDTGTPTDTAASDVPDASDAADTAADTGLAPDSAGTEDVPDSSPGCVDACTAGAVACDGAARIVCVHGDNGCLVWSAPTACGAGTACVAGRCDPLPPARFAAAPTAWAVPALGGADDAGFYALSGTPGAVGYDVWATTDLTGDGLPDLVVTGRAGEKAGYDWFSRVLGFGGAPHWDVYANTGSGFATTPTSWAVPAAGGAADEGFSALSGSPGGLGYDAWTTVDLTGDGRPDLVVTARAGEKAGYDWFSRVLGFGGAPRWDVYANTGSGFATSPTAWAVPASGGADDEGFSALSGSPGGLGYDAWTTADLTGDGRPDLVVTARAGEKAGYSWFSRVLGFGATPHWDVYPNTGSGFAATATAWAVPAAGGADDEGFSGLSGSPGGLGYDGWTTIDLTGDGRPDLVVTARAGEKAGYSWFARVLGFGDAPHWEVYENTGSGFAATPTTWAVPAAGGAEDEGFAALAGTPGGVGYDTWTTTDLSGDGRPDLVVTGRAGEKAGYSWFSRVLGFGVTPHWEVYANTGAGFAATPVVWAVPAGGGDDEGFFALGGTPGAVGYDAWATTDLTGDGVPDLVVTGRAGEKAGYSWFSRVLGFGAAPRWDVYPASP